jgi:hypothetical protein
MTQTKRIDMTDKNDTSMKDKTIMNGKILILLSLIIFQVKGIGENVVAYRDKAAKEQLAKSAMQVLARDTKPSLEKDLVLEKGAK